MKQIDPPGQEIRGLADSSGFLFSTGISRSDYQYFTNADSNLNRILIAARTANRLVVIPGKDGSMIEEILQMQLRTWCDESNSNFLEVRSDGYGWAGCRLRLQIGQAKAVEMVDANTGRNRGEYSRCCATKTFRKRLAGLP